MAETTDLKKYLAVFPGRINITLGNSYANGIRDLFGEYPFPECEGFNRDSLVEDLRSLGGILLELRHTYPELPVTFPEIYQVAVKPLEQVFETAFNEFSFIGQAHIKIGSYEPFPITECNLTENGLMFCENYEFERVEIEKDKFRGFPLNMVQNFTFQLNKSK